ncbi:MAG: SHOCT domain-containing protein [Clostridia bacterium]|nr:SHOCT domain-containing protein [Clostridia bacterium]
MENKKANLKFSFGALLGLIIAVWNIISMVRSGEIVIQTLCTSALLVVLCFIVLLKKRGLALVVPAALIALVALTCISFGNLLYTAVSVLSLVTDICLVVLASGSMKADGTAKGSRAAVSGLIVSAILDMSISVAITILRYAGDYYYYTIQNIPTIARTILGGLALILIGLWIANPYKKEKPAAQDAPTDEFYISTGKHVLLLLFTFGIWSLIWTCKATKYANHAKNAKQRGPVAAVLLCIFVPFYIFFWTYQTARNIDSLAQEKNVHSDIAVLCLILTFFIGIVPPIIMQNKINQTILGTSTPTNPELQSAESLEKYKELLDKGIITQEDYDAKKKQLLGL